jgi:hypothetical protein
MIIKIYRKKCKKQKEYGEEERRGLTFTIIVFHHNKNFRGEHPKMEKIW